MPTQQSGKQNHHPDAFSQSPPPKLFSRVAEIAFYLIWTAITVIVSYWLGQKSYSWMPPQATLEAQKVDDLFSFLVTLGSVVFLGIFGMIAHSIVTCRAERGDFSEGHPVRRNTWVEIVWTGIPALLVVWISLRAIHVYSLLDLQGLATFTQAPIRSEYAVPSASSDQSIAQMPRAAETVDVVAKQWAWSFHYREQDITSAELHLLVNQRTKLVLTSPDVLHGFYVPAFRIKQDIVPDRDINFIFSPTLEGKYRLQDSQFSGTFFPLMQADVYVESPADYESWFSQLSKSPETRTDRVADLSAQERANPPDLWGHRWAISSPAAADAAANPLTPSASTDKAPSAPPKNS